MKTNLLKMASKMPEEAYSFRPVPEVETLPARSPYRGANLLTCAGLQGETKPFDFTSRTVYLRLKGVVPPSSSPD